MASPPHPHGPAACRIALDAPTIDIDAHQLLGPIDLTHPAWRKEYLVAGAPPAGVDPDVSYGPVGSVDHELLDMPNHAVEQMDAVADDGFDTAQVRIAPFCRGRPMRHGKVL
jgi:hypothetical protein